MYSDKLTIVLQGRLTEGVDINKTISLYSKFAPIIISGWDFDEEKLKNVVCQRVILGDYQKDIISRKKKDCEDGKNILAQYTTTYRGLKEVTTPFVLKGRLDQFYPNIDKIIDKILNTNKVVTSTRVINPYTLHFSDMLYGGNTEKLLKTFEKLYFDNIENFELCCPEMKIWATYWKLNISQDLPYLNTSQPETVDPYIEAVTPYFEVCENKMLAGYSDRDRTLREVIETGWIC